MFQIQEEDERVDQIIKKVEASYGLSLIEIAGYQSGDFVDRFTQERVDTDCYRLVFENASGDEIWAGIVLLNGSFTIPAANYCSGWLAFDKDEFPEIRFLRHSNEAIVFCADNRYTREQLLRGIVE